jgi:hypothetical protein
VPVFYSEQTTVDSHSPKAMYSQPVRWLRKGRTEFRTIMMRAQMIA